MGNNKVGKLRGGERFEIVDVEMPEAGADDIVLQVNSCGICGTDLSFLRSGSAPDGIVLGHEFSGTVVSTGRNVSGIAPGDRVTANPMVNLLGLGRIPGAFAEYLRVPAPQIGKNLFKLPGSISDEIGALVEPFAVGLHAVNRSGAKPGEKIAIFGAGPIGICVLAALIANGIQDIVVIDPSKLRRDFASQMGAAAVHDPAAGSATAFIGAHFGEMTYSYMEKPVAQADIMFDCAGVQAVLDDSVYALKSGGKLILVADPHDLALPVRYVMQHELQVIGAVGYENEFDAAIELLASGKVDLSAMVTHRYPLSQIADAFRMQADPENAMKVLVQAGA